MGSRRLAPAPDWRIEDTWHVMGLRGTGSHHIVLNDVIAPEANFIELEKSTPCLPGPLYQSVRHLLPLSHSAFAVGVAEGALDDLLAVANSGRQQLRAAAPTRDSEIFRYELGRSVAGEQLRPHLWSKPRAIGAMRSPEPCEVRPS